MKILFFVTILVTSTSAFADKVYMSAEKFIEKNFDAVPQSKVVWLTKDLQQQVKTILGHKYHRLRIRYWQENQRSAWILEEIGKERYITAGFIVNDNKLEQVKLLVFRESRGWEIQYSYFAEQFKQAALTDSLQLDRRIDNITGATLSVNAMKHMAELALFLHQWVNNESAKTQ